MKDDRIYLDDMLQSIRRILEYTQGGKGAFDQSPMIQDAVIRNFTIIGEATKRLSPELRDTYPQIAWRRMAGFRDVLIHGYKRLDLSVIWDTVENSLPGLESQLAAILEQLNQD